MAGPVAFTVPTYHGCQSGKAFGHDLRRCVCPTCDRAACGTCARRFGCSPCGSPEASSGPARHWNMRSRAEDRRADLHDRALGRAVAAWARHPDGSLPKALLRETRRKHNHALVRLRAYQEQRDAGLHGPALDDSLDLIDYAVKHLR